MSTSPAPASVTDTCVENENTETNTETNKESKLDSNETAPAGKESTPPAAQDVEDAVILRGKKLAVVFAAMLMSIFLIALEQVFLFLFFMFSNNSNQNEFLPAVQLSFLLLFLESHRTFNLSPSRGGSQIPSSSHKVRVQAKTECRESSSNVHFYL
jgi:hypothetical protein